MSSLQKVTITFNTHGENKDGDTILHVFVKNRSNTSSTPESATDFISNLLAYQRYEADSELGYNDINPYLAFGENLAQGTSFDDPSSHIFEIPLRSKPIPLEEIILPVVNIHILPNGSDLWIFDYTIIFLFDDGRSFPASSNTDGMTGIILDQDNLNYSLLPSYMRYLESSPIGVLLLSQWIVLTPVRLRKQTLHVQASL